MSDTRIALVTCEGLPGWEQDDEQLEKSLVRYGVQLSKPNWNDPTVNWSSFDLCLIRTTWDYTKHRDQFERWVEHVSAQTQLLNSEIIVRWNLSKTYLRELAESGVSVLPTCWIDVPLSREEFEQKLRYLGLTNATDFAFIKPVVGACAEDTLRFKVSNLDQALEHIADILPRCGVMVQPYLETVETLGEYSAIYFDGQLSHCVQKIPVEGDYRVQDDFGATDKPVGHKPGLISLSEHCLAEVGRRFGVPTIARVDALQDNTGRWYLNELELIEPSLFFRHSPTAASMLSRLLLRRVGREGDQAKVENLSDPRLYFNRELSSIAFNRRVLALAEDANTPLLERLRYLTIVSSNLDEFYEVRVAGVRQCFRHGVPLRNSDQLSARTLIPQINLQCQELVRRQYQILNEQLLPQLSGYGVRILRRQEWTEEQSQWIRQHFISEILPLLTPIGLDPSHPIPNVQNKSLNFILQVSGPDAFERESSEAILQIPRCLPRIIRLPKTVATGPCDFVLISSVVHENVHLLFRGMTISGCYQFRVTRNADMLVDEDEVEDLLTALKGELHGRNFGAAVRLEVADNCPQELIDILLHHHNLRADWDLFQVNGPVNLHRLGQLIDSIDQPQLLYPPFVPGLPKALKQSRSCFDIIDAGDILLHHPYRSFRPVLDIVLESATDPQVLAIKITLYRVGSDSPLVEALMNAARAGKDITVVMELRARFDEAANIGFAQRMTAAGVRVVYGIVNYKCHAKMMLIVRRGTHGLRRYAHIGTGNYHLGNAKLYTDYSLMTSNEQLTEDVHFMFLELTGLGEMSHLNRSFRSPFTLYPALLNWIDEETSAAQLGQPSWIIIKVNSLTEPSVIRALYRASQAGVKISLVVRGICSLIPGIPGVSENIRVSSIIGRFLEHHRVYSFCAGGEERIYLSSADLMERNLHRRVELCVPILDPTLHAQLKNELQEVFVKDNSQAWEMASDCTYTRATTSKTEDIKNAQSMLLEQLSEPMTI